MIPNSMTVIFIGKLRTNNRTEFIHLSVICFLNYFTRCYRSK